MRATEEETQAADDDALTENEETLDESHETSRTDSTEQHRHSDHSALGSTCD